MSLFRSRRSLKPLAMDPAREVPPALVMELLEDANWAPTHGLTQPWRFHVFTGAGKVRLGEALQAIYDVITPVGNRDADKRAKLAGGPAAAPVVIALAARVVPGGKIPEWEEVAAVSCAAQNLMLSAHAHGLGSFWSTPPAASCADFVQWLGLDETHRALGLIYLGWPMAGKPLPTSQRENFASRVTFHAT